MDEFQHPLFFEAKDLTDRDKEKIRRYFMANWESGGGECGMIETTGDNACKICFNKMEVQEKVLQRKFHTISLPSGDLQLTVSRTGSPQTANWRLAETITKTNTNDLKKIFKIDIYLMYYLRDNPKAHKPLEKQLSAIGCSVELDFNQEEAVVRGDIEKGPGRGFGAAEKWEIQVERVFIGLTGSYVCCNVLDPKQIRALEQDTSFDSDDIRVYRETGCYVVVGEVGAVKDRIDNLEKRVTIQKEITVVEKKFEMVKEEFTRRMCATYPEVYILIGNTMIILEGPSKEVQSGATRLDELMNQVKEKRLNLPIELINFIKSSSAMSKYQAGFQQNLTNPVSLEVGSDLVLFSLSSDALDEAEAAIVGDLRVDTVQLQGAAAVPPDVDRIKEMITKAKNQANCRELRVDASFSPGTSGTSVTKVQLVGYRENVNKLKEILHDYQMNHVRTQEVMALSPDLVDCFDKVLDLLEVKQTEVTLKASDTPHPHVLVSGPCCRVQEAQRNLRTSLASLISDTLVLEGSGAQQYFQREGRTNMELVEAACKVIIREGKCVHSPNVTTKPGQAPQWPHVNPQQPLFDNTDLSILCTSSTNQQSVFQFLGLTTQTVSTAMTKLKDLYQAQCSTQTFTQKQLEGLTQDEINDLEQLVEAQGLYMQRNQPGEGSLTVSGSNYGVSQVMQMLNKFLQGSLIREIRARNEDELYPRVAWCILGHNGNWERLPKTANYDLEKNGASGGIVDAQGNSWSVNLQAIEATRRQNGQKTKLKRLENPPDFTLPLYWDNMTTTETMKVVDLHPSSAEYRAVKEAFRQTVTKTVTKIERVQNIHLRRAYEALKKQMSDKNKLDGGAREKLLYHGTSKGKHNSIMKNGFNRSFAGQNATSYGQGTYFAVDARYSAKSTYSKPAADGSQLMFVARVLTGTYTDGHSNMKMPPPRNGQHPDNFYDSLVNNKYNPSMYVVFHDSQAYPDYLITFKWC